MFVDTQGMCGLQTKGKFHKEERIVRVLKELRGRKEPGGVSGAMGRAGDQIIKVS